MTYTAQQYRDCAQLYLHSAHAALAHADRLRLSGCRDLAVMYSNNAARYRKAYAHRMQQAREAAQ